VTVADETDEAAPIIIIGGPDQNPGPTAMRCMACNKPFPVRMNTVMTVHQLTKQDKAFLVLCYFCFAPLRRRLGDSAAVGMDAARRMLGLGV
jgi:hypothetical protein